MCAATLERLGWRAGRTDGSFSLSLSRSLGLAGGGVSLRRLRELLSSARERRMPLLSDSQFGGGQSACVGGEVRGQCEVTASLPVTPTSRSRIARASAAAAREPEFSSRSCCYLPKEEREKDGEVTAEVGDCLRRGGMFICMRYCADKTS